MNEIPQSFAKSETLSRLRIIDLHSPAPPASGGGEVEDDVYRSGFVIVFTFGVLASAITATLAGYLWWASF